MSTAVKNNPTKYTMKISRLTIDKLGIHMYDRVSAVLAELIANSYDADATKVTVTLPFGKYLAKKKVGKTIDLGFEISIEDDGIGMLSHDVNEYYLKIGANRRSSRGETTPSGRPVLGRKGIGKLAPFGICREIEVITAGGDGDGSGNYEVCDLLLQQWGVALLKELASGSETSFRNQVWGEFLERSRLKERLQRAHPGDPTLRDAIQRAAKSLVRSVDREQVRRNDDFVDRVVKLAFAVGPHETLLYAMDDVAALTTGTLEPVIELFEKASVVEMYSLGQVARERVDAVETLEKLIGSASTEEYQLQRLIEHAPWILYPDWTPLTRNQPLKSLRAAFATWYQRNKGKEIITTSIGSNKRPDFLMLNYSGFIEIVEIKRPKHALTDEEYERAFNYHHAVMKFLEENDQLRELFPKVRLTIVCEKLALRPVNANAIDNDDNIAHKTWDTVLHHTIQAHQDFLSRVHELQGPPPPLPERE